MLGGRCTTPNVQQLRAFDSQASSIAGPCTPATLAKLKLNFRAITQNNTPILQIILLRRDFWGVGVPHQACGPADPRLCLSPRRIQGPKTQQPCTNTSHPALASGRFIPAPWSCSMTPLRHLRGSHGPGTARRVRKPGLTWPRGCQGWVWWRHGRCGGVSWAVSVGTGAMRARGKRSQGWGGAISSRPGPSRGPSEGQRRGDFCLAPGAAGPITARLRWATARPPIIDNGRRGPQPITAEQT